MRPEDAAKILLASCEGFLAKYGNALPRIAARGVGPVMTALFDLLNATGHSEKVVLVMQYEIAREGLRKIRDDQELLAYGQVFYDRETSSFGWRAISKPIQTPWGVGQIALPGVRTVTLDDLREMGITVQELIDHVRMQATKVELAELQKLATQKPAMA